MKKLALFFSLAYLITWTIWLPLILPKYGINNLAVLPRFHHYLGSFGPMLAAIIVSLVYGGAAGVKVLLNRLVKWKISWKWYLVVTLIPVLLVVLCGYANQLLTGQSFSMKGFSTNEEFPQFGPWQYLLFNFFTFGIGEETGWRGFALPLLQKRFSALAATLVLALLWACWHIPAFIYRPLYSQMDVAGIAGFFISMLMGAIVLTWLYNSTKGSLLIVAIFHAMVELMFISANITPAISGYLGAIFMVAALSIILITKPKNLSFAERQISV